MMLGFFLFINIMQYCTFLLVVLNLILAIYTWNPLLFDKLKSNEVKKEVMVSEALGSTLKVSLIEPQEAKKIIESHANREKKNNLCLTWQGSKTQGELLEQKIKDNNGKFFVESLQDETLLHWSVISSSSFEQALSTLSVSFDGWRICTEKEKERFESKEP